MKKILLTGLMIAAFSYLNGQTEVEVVTGAGYTLDAYYNMETGNIDTVKRGDWDIAFNTGQMSISVLANNGSGVQLYTYPKGDIGSWSSLDTAGIKDWTPMYNSIETFEEGAFIRNAIPGDELDYGWGQYNILNHHIVGDSLFVIKTVAGDYKKIWIVDKAAMTNTWIFKYANIDGTDETEVTFKASDYNTKEFICYSIDNKVLVDREPVSESWDLLFTRFYDYTIPYYVSGVLTNEYNGIESLEIQADGLQQDTTLTYDKAMFRSDISIIGSDWKSFNNGTFTYDVATDVVYFIKKKIGNTATYRKIYFTAFDFTVGKYVFKQEDMEVAVSAGPETKISLLNLYPNPSSDFVNLVYDAKDDMEVTIFDTSGKLVYKQLPGKGFSNLRIDVRDLSEGIYFVKVQSGNESSSLKFIKN